MAVTTTQILKVRNMLVAGSNSITARVKTQTFTKRLLIHQSIKDLNIYFSGHPIKILEWNKAIFSSELLTEQLVNWIKENLTGRIYLLPFRYPNQTLSIYFENVDDFVIWNLTWG